jgi:nitrate reductase NapE component
MRSRFPESEKRLLLWTAVIASLVLPALLCLAYIGKYGSNLVMLDEWRVALDLQALHSGRLTFGYLFAQHNEHRLLFPRLLMLGLAKVSSFNSMYEMYMGWVFLCATGFLLFRSHMRSGRLTPGWVALAIPPTWLFFTTRQWENLLWGWQLQVFLAVLSFVSASYLLEKSRGMDRRFILALACALVSSFSFADGLLVWPVCLAQFLFQRRGLPEGPKKSALWPAGLWACIGMGVYFVYLHHYVRPAYHPSTLYCLQHPGMFFSYMAVALGSPVTGVPESAFPIGCLLACIYAVAFLRFRSARSFLPLSLMLFSVLSAAMLGVGRSGSGVDQAYSSRYVTISLLGIIGLYEFLFHAEWGKIKPVLCCIAVCLMVAGVTKPQEGLMSTTRRWKMRTEVLSYLTLMYKYPAGELLKEPPDPHVPKDAAAFLEQQRLNVFRRPRTDFASLPGRLR